MIANAKAQPIELSSKDRKAQKPLTAVTTHRNKV